jgi:dolichol-phosphate mannosyltransferase
MLLSVVVPAYNEEQNLELFHQRLCDVLDPTGTAWELVIVDDHSRDATFEVIGRLAAKDRRVRGLRLAKNSGSHVAFTAGLAHALGDAAAVLPADLQDPPELVPQMLARWRGGAQVVWAVRTRRLGETRSTLFFSWLFHFLMRRVFGLKALVPSGADSFMLDRTVIDAIARFGEANTNMLALVAWMGFRQERFEYEKQARHAGTSGWTLDKKLKLFVDSVVAFSDLPLRSMVYLGTLTAALGLAYALLIVWNAFHGHPIEGWSSLMVVTLLLGGTQLLMVGVMGEYLWRVLEEGRRRPRYLVEAATGAVEAQVGA